MPQTVHTVPVDRSGSFIATRPAKPITKNSPIRVEAQSVRIACQPLPQQQPGLADRDHGTGDQHPGARELALLLGEGDRRLQGVVQPRLDLDAVLAEDLDGDARPARRRPSRGGWSSG